MGGAVNMEVPEHITQISATWLRKVEKNTNLKAGPGIKITPDGDGVKIELDQDVFKQWLWSAVVHQLFYATPPLGVCPLTNLGDIILDPGL